MKQIEDYKNKINEYLKTKPALSLKKAGELLKVEVKTTPQFKLTETISGIELSQEIRNAAFALKPGQISGILSSPSAFFLIEQDKLHQYTRPILLLNYMFLFQMNIHLIH